MNYYPHFYGEVPGAAAYPASVPYVYAGGEHMTFYFDPQQQQHPQPLAHSNQRPRPQRIHKLSIGSRKDSADSGISVVSHSTDRKISNSSTISTGSCNFDESSHLDDIKEEQPFEEPDDEMCEKISQQVEFYFSDANITKDKFLLKHVKRNKEGFVSLKLISSFKRVKHLTKDWRVVAHAIKKKSNKLEVNDEGSKVRRIDPLPDYDETTPSRTVVALNLPLERPTIEGVAEIFSSIGEIVLIRILRPGNPIPADVKPFVTKNPEMIEKVCALIEFERTELALKAVRELNGKISNENEGETKVETKPMTVVELITPPPKSTRKESYASSGTSSRKSSTISNYGSEYGSGFRRPSFSGINNSSSGQAMPKRRVSLMANTKFSDCGPSGDAHHPDSNTISNKGLNPNAPTFQMSDQRGSQRKLSRTHYSTNHSQSVHQNFDSGHQPCQSQWMMRRMSVHQNPVEHKAPSGLVIPPNVVRLPRGPDDKGNGFKLARTTTAKPQSSGQTQGAEATSEKNDASKQKDIEGKPLIDERIR